MWVYVRTIAIVTQNKYNMNQKFETLTREGQQFYASPSVNVVDIHSEGLLCGSFDSANNGYDYENDLGEI